MKKHIVITALCTLGPISCMDQPPADDYKVRTIGYMQALPRSTREPREWPAPEYAQANQPQISCFESLLKRVETEGKDIISFGCGTGEIEKNLAQTALSVHGTDASKQMIDYAQRTHLTQENGNLSFEHCFVEDFKTNKLHDLAFTASCFHWFEDKPKALRAISNSLRPGGFFLANIETEDNPKPFALVAKEEMLAEHPYIEKLLSVVTNPTGSSYLTTEELHDLLKQENFQNINSTVESFDFTMTADEWRTYQLPILLSTPGAQAIINLTSEENWCTNKASGWAYWAITKSPEEQKQHDAPFFPNSSDELVKKIRKNDFCRYFFNHFLNRCIKKLQDNGDGTYTWKYETTVILAQKKVNDEQKYYH